MKCKDFEPLIYLYRNGELTDTEETLLKNHIKQCEYCRELQNSTQSLKNIIESPGATDSFKEHINLQNNIMLKLDSEGYFEPHEHKNNSYRNKHVTMKLLIKTAIAASILIFTFQAGSVLNNRKQLEDRMKARSNMAFESRGNLKKRLSRLLHNGAPGITPAAAIINPDMELTGEEVVISAEVIKQLLSEYMKLRKQNDRFLRALSEISPRLSEINLKDGISRNELRTIIQNKEKIQSAIVSW